MEFTILIKQEEKEQAIVEISKQDTLSICTDKEILVITLTDLLELLRKDAKEDGSTALYNKEPVSKKMKE